MNDYFSHIFGGFARPTLTPGTKSARGYHNNKFQTKGCVPMPNKSYTTQLKTIRVRNETLEYFRDKKLNRAVDSLSELLRRGVLEFDGENLIVVRGGVDGTPAAPCFTDSNSSESVSDVSFNSSAFSKKESSMSIDLDNEIGKDLIQMLSLSRKSPDDFVKDVHGLLESGSLIYENGKLRVEVGFNYEPFLEFCRKHNARPKKVFENIMEEIYKEFGRE